MSGEKQKPPQWEIKRKDGKILISTVTRYDKQGKPVTENIWVTGEEIQELQKKGQEFDIIMAPDGGIDTVM